MKLSKDWVNETETAATKTGKLFSPMFYTSAQFSCCFAVLHSWKRKADCSWKELIRQMKE